MFLKSQERLTESVSAEGLIFPRRILCIAQYTGTWLIFYLKAPKGLTAEIPVASAVQLAGTRR